MTAGAEDLIGQPPAETARTSDNLDVVAARGKLAGEDGCPERHVIFPG
jgi:hypothetical protein